MKVSIIHAVTIMVVHLFVSLLVFAPAADAIIRDEDQEHEDNHLLLAAEGEGRRLAPTSTNYYFAVLNRAETVPFCTASAGTFTPLGNAIFTYDTVTFQLCGRLGYTGLSGPELLPTRIFNGLVTSPLGPTILVFPTSGLPTAKQACWTLTTAQQALLASKQLFVVIRTSACPQGELRGHILQSV